MKKRDKYYFLMGFMVAMIFAVIFVGGSTTLTAHQFESGADCGKEPWNPCYVKIVK